MKFKQILAGMLCIFALAGCSSIERTKPILTPHTTLAQHVTDGQVKQAILEAGHGRDWVMAVAGPGVINATQNARSHSATVRINYNEKGYTINYVSSSNLMASGGKIHRAYNKWVNNLDHDIQVKLSAISAAAK